MSARDEHGRFAPSANAKMNALLRQAAGRGQVTAVVDVDDLSPQPERPTGPAGLDGGAGREQRAEPIDMNAMIRAMSGRGAATRVATNGIRLRVR